MTAAVATLSNAGIGKQQEQQQQSPQGAVDVMKVTASLDNLQLRQMVKENHGKAISMLAFNSEASSPRRQQMLATVGSNQLNIYDNAHYGNHLDLTCHFVNATTSYSKGGALDALCWLAEDPHARSTVESGDGGGGDIVIDALIAVGGESGDISIISVAQTRVIVQLSCNNSDANSDADSHAIVCLCAVPNHPELLLSSSTDGAVRLWSIKGEGKCIAVLSVEYPQCALAVDPTGRFLVVGGHDDDGWLGCWDLHMALEHSGPEPLTLLFENGLTCQSETPWLGASVDCLLFVKGEKESDSATAPIKLAAHSINGRIQVYAWTPPSATPADDAANTNDNGTAAEPAPLCVPLAKMSLPSTSKNSSAEATAAATASKSLPERRCRRNLTASRDGSLICCGSTSGNVGVFDMCSGKKMQKIEVRRGRQTSLAECTSCTLTPKDNGVLVGISTGFLLRWDQISLARKRNIADTATATAAIAAVASVASAAAAIAAAAEKASSSRAAVDMDMGANNKKRKVVAAA